jgi:hypothetical protein
MEFERGVEGLTWADATSLLGYHHNDHDDNCAATRYVRDRIIRTSRKWNSHPFLIVACFVEKSSLIDKDPDVGPCSDLEKELQISKPTRRISVDEIKTSIHLRRPTSFPALPRR